MQSRWILASGLAFSAAALAAGCGDYPSLTDISPPQAILDDTDPPSIRLEAPTSVVDGSESISATVVDGVRVRTVTLMIARANGLVLWESESLVVDVDSADVSIPLDLPVAFPYGDTVYFTVLATDVAGNTGAFVRDPSEAAMVFLREGVIACETSNGTLQNASVCLPTLVVAHGRTYRLPGNGEIGGTAYDPLLRRLYMTDRSNNNVRAFFLVEKRFSDWSIAVGSKPEQIAFERFGWGVQPTLAVVNAGGTDVSMVDLDMGGRGGEERWRVPIPLIRVVLDGDTIPLQPTASSVLIHCADDFCQNPKLFLGSPKVSETNRVITRSLSLTALDPNDGFDLLTPLYHSGFPSTDEEVTIEAYVVDPSSGSATALITPRSVSKCGTLAIGGSLLATSEQRDGPLFLVETGAGQMSCGEPGRVLRLSREGEHYRVSAAAVLHVEFDDELRQIQDIAVNADASLVLLRAGDKILVADGTLRRLGMVEVKGARSVAFLEGQTNGARGDGEGALFAVSGGDGIDVFETIHFTKVTHLITKGAVSSFLRFVRMPSAGEFVLFGANEDGDGLIAVYTQIPGF